MYNLKYQITVFPNNHLMTDKISLSDSILAYRHSLNQYIFLWLRNQILTLQPGFQPGDRLNSQSIADSLGVSKTPVAYAINQLAAQNLITVKARSGTFVTSFTNEEVRETFDLLSLLESASLRMLGSRPSALNSECINSMQKAIREAESSVSAKDLERYLEAERHFHNSIAGLCGNAKLQPLHLSAFDHAHLANASIATIESNVKINLADHSALTNALVEAVETKSLETSVPRIVQQLEDHWLRKWDWYLESHTNGLLKK